MILCCMVVNGNRRRPQHLRSDTVFFYCGLTLFLRCLGLNLRALPTLVPDSPFFTSGIVVLSRFYDACDDRADALVEMFLTASASLQFSSIEGLPIIAGEPLGYRWGIVGVPLDHRSCLKPVSAIGCAQAMVFARLLRRAFFFLKTSFWVNYYCNDLRTSSTDLLKGAASEQLGSPVS